ncbi:MAG TPA: protein phosphatase 2C domain-containing protein [Gemmataceae bacterium]|jgi:protein phosphatase|nr:protein phosphatase 2C domain-containing protein [Gemmataceae bacterium]
MSDDSDPDTVDDMPALSAGAGAAPISLHVDFDGRTSRGLVRPTNEDHFHIVHFGRYLRTQLSSLPAGAVDEEFEPPGYGFVVADGVGGHAAGETASRLAIRLLVEFALQTPDWILGVQDDHLDEVMDRFARRFQSVNFAILTLAETDPKLKGMGTTLSLAVSLRDRLIVAHLGDSRVYLLRREKLHRLTHDHTMSQQVDDPSGSGPVRFRRVLTRAIGLPQTGGEPDLFQYQLEDRDRLLLCTDGLTDMVGEDTIASELGRAASAADACRKLVDLALERGGRDNVTVVVANYRWPDAPAK